jgi:hypothetical protein
MKSKMIFDLIFKLFIKNVLRIRNWTSYENE